METSNNGERNVGQSINTPVKEVGERGGLLREEATGKYDRMSVPGWQKWIDANIENFKGNRENAALLMKGFAEGINYVQKKTATGIVKDFQYPNIEVTADDIPDSPNIECAGDGRTIHIKKAFLEKASSLDINSTRTAKSKNDEITFVGTTRDMFLLTGVEEGHHASFLQNSSKNTNNSGKINAAEYNADDAEFNALKLKLLYAKENNMSTAMIELLNKQVDEAMEVRRRPERFL